MCFLEYYYLYFHKKYNLQSFQVIRVSCLIGLFFLQTYKILTGTLLTVFVPQKCEENINEMKPAPADAQNL